MRRNLVFLVLSLFWATAGAQTAEAPPPPEVDVAGAEGPMEPEISITEEEDRTLYEYRTSGGQLLMVKVVPKKGRPYYLLDTDGDGELDTRQYDPRTVAVQMWEIFRW